MASQVSLSRCLWPLTKLAAIFLCLSFIYNCFGFSAWFQGGRPRKDTGGWGLLPASIGGDIYENITLEGETFRDIVNRTLGFQQIFVINLGAPTGQRDLTAAARATDLDLTYLHGAKEANNKPSPLAASGRVSTAITQHVFRAWKSHMEVARFMVEQGITTALVLGDDVEWDVRVKSQMQTFAKAARVLLQPRAGTRDRSWDPTNPRTPKFKAQPQDLLLEKPTENPTSSPYSDIDLWDFLTLGHCGTDLPTSDDSEIPLGRVPIFYDETVADPRYMAHQLGLGELYRLYPAHTRMIHHSKGTNCAGAYALTINAARRLVCEMDFDSDDGGTDEESRSICEGVHKLDPGVCLTVQPSLFEVRHRAGSPGSTSGKKSHHIPKSRYYSPID